MKTSSAKAKGRNFQKWICKKISEAINIPWGYEDDKWIQPRLMGQSGTDVILRNDAYINFPFDVECKATESISLYQAIEQTKSNNKDKKRRKWILFHKKNREKPIVIMDAEVFFKMITYIGCIDMII